MTEQKCPYCDKEVAARGAKNHVRLSTGDGHGPKGELPEDYDGPVSGDSGGEEGAEAEAPTDGAEQNENDSAAVQDGSEPAEVTADEIGDTEPDVQDSDDGEESDGYPFDPSAEGAIQLDGDETLYVRSGGDIVEAEPAEGDWLLITDDGPVLYDDETGERFEVVTE